MRIVLLTEGHAFTVYAVNATRGRAEHCLTLEFLEQISEPSRKSLVALIQQHAERGPILNVRRSRPLGEGILEFKSRQGDRILFFYPAGQRGVTILTHGFRKGARLRTEIERAIALRMEYLDSLR